MRSARDRVHSALVFLSSFLPMTVRLTLVTPQVYVRRGDTVFRDMLEWDLANPVASVTLYATEVSSGVGTAHFPALRL
jgi:hypothetical protein